MPTRDNSKPPRRPARRWWKSIPAVTPMRPRRRNPARTATHHAGGRTGVSLGLAVNAGHGLHYHNVQAIAALPGVEELNIGHAIVAQAIFVGWENAVREMKRLMKTSRRVCFWTKIALFPCGVWFSQNRLAKIV
jgi:hypothetical protein